MKTYFDDRKASYRAPEYRGFAIVLASSAGLAKPAEVSDDDAKALYDKLRDSRFIVPEKRKLQQIVFANEAEADEAEAKIKAGAAFDDIVKARNLKPADIDLGETTKAGMFDHAIADAAFALPEGGVSDVVKGQFGPAIVRVVAIAPASVKSFAEVEDALKKEIATDRAAGDMQTLHDKIEDARVAGKSLTEAAKDVGLETRAIAAVDAQGLDPTGAAVDLPEKALLLRSVFASDVGVDDAALQTKDRGYLWFEVAKVDPARERTFDEVKDAVEKQWRADEVARLLGAKALDMVKQLDAGATVASLAQSAGLESKSAADIRRRGGAGLAESVVSAVFALPPNGAGSAATPDGRVVFKITADATPPTDANDPAIKQAAARLADALQSSFVAQYVTALERRTRRDDPRQRPSGRRGRLRMTTMNVQRLRRFRAPLRGRARERRADDAGRRPRDAGVGLSQARGGAFGQHVPARVGRGRRAARALFDDRARSRRRLALDRRGRRNQPARPERAGRFRPLPRQAAGGAARACWRNRKSICRPGLPPMSAGVFGYLGYDMVRQMERLAPAKPDPIGVPEAIAHPPDHHGRVRQRARRNGRRDAGAPCPRRIGARGVRKRAGAPRRGRRRARSAARSHRRPRSIRPCWPAEAVSNTSEAEFLGDGRQGEGLHRRRRRVPDRAVAALHQPLRSARLLALSRAAARQSLALPLLPRFRRLSDRRLEPGNPGARARAARSSSAPSPARAGAARREAEDAALAAELLADPKERAEHLMLLDLGRNDVGRVAKIGTVKVTDSFFVERYSHVMHIVSNVEGDLRHELDNVAALAAGFPAGTVSGAPKVRAMEIIDELEKDKRGIYAGCIGYFGAGGEMDTCIVLRASVVKDGMMHVQAGAGVVYDSDPAYEQTANASTRRRRCFARRRKRCASPRGRSGGSSGRRLPRRSADKVKGGGRGGGGPLGGL